MRRACDPRIAGAISSNAGYEYRTGNPDAHPRPQARAPDLLDAPDKSSMRAYGLSLAPSRPQTNVADNAWCLPFTRSQHAPLKGNDMEIKVPDGVFNAYVFRPAMIPAPAVIVLQEIFGVNADLRATCDEPWFTLNIREDELRGVNVGSSLMLTEAGTGRTNPARVTDWRRV